MYVQNRSIVMWTLFTEHNIFIILPFYIWGQQQQTSHLPGGYMDGMQNGIFLKKKYVLR